MLKNKCWIKPGLEIFAKPTESFFFCIWIAIGSKDCLRPLRLVRVIAHICFHMIPKKCHKLIIPAELSVDSQRKQMTLLQNEIIVKWMKQIITKKLVLIRQKYYTTIPQKGKWIVVDIYIETRSVEVNNELYATTLRGERGEKLL